MKPTIVSSVADALVLWVKHSFLQHAQDDDGADPELNPQQIPPVAGAPEEPEGAEQHVHDAHDHEELWRTEEREEKRSVLFWLSLLKTNTDLFLSKLWNSDWSQHKVFSILRSN